MSRISNMPHDDQHRLTHRVPYVRVAVPPEDSRVSYLLLRVCLASSILIGISDTLLSRRRLGAWQQ